VRLTAEAKKAGNPFRFAILDLTIPGGRGGKDVVQELLAIDPSTKMIVSSGYSEDPVMAEPAKYGFCARLTKPYDIGEMKRVLKRLSEGA
jgi:two-component system, cell cycle sensor histidine kinase and response regulator CckA